MIGSLVLFSLLGLSINSSVTESSKITLQTKYIKDATNISQQLINEISSKAFDQNVIGATSLLDIDSLTTHSNLGKEVGEVYPDFNDVDDYHGGIFSFSNTVTGTYVANVYVNYVNFSNLMTVVTSRERIKRIEVEIKSDNLESSVKNYYFDSY